MPGYDGTGPRGKGPMTGKGDGYCTMEISDEPRGAGNGFVGLSGAPGPFERVCAVPEAHELSWQIARVRSTLLDIESGLGYLEAAAVRTDGASRPTSARGAAE